MGIAGNRFSYSNDSSRISWMMASELQSQITFALKSCIRAVNVKSYHRDEHNNVIFETFTIANSAS